jgi:hypothetical protein
VHGGPFRCDELLLARAKLEILALARDIQDVSGPLPDEGAN